MQIRSGRAALLGGTLIIATLAATPVASADESVTVVRSPKLSDPRPGPEILRRPLARAPQLENTGVWRAEPTLVSGASAYRRGEFLYQDFLYDDTALAYPADKAYRTNAADVVEIRLRPLRDALAVRIIYNTMIDPELVATTLALGASAQAREMPHNGGALMPAEVFITAKGTSGYAVDASSGDSMQRAGVQVGSDLQRRQVDVRIPYSVFDPRGRANVRVGAATGLWDNSAQRYLRPNPDKPAFYNVGFRYSEDNVSEGPGGVRLPGSPWMDAQQNAALSTKDLTPFFAEVDFTKLAAGTDDALLDQPMGTPRSGPINRIYASHFEPQQGRGTEANSGGEICGAPDCAPPYAGQLQPYSVYVPAKPRPSGGYGVTLTPHPSGGNHNTYFGSAYQRQLGERGSGSLVVGGNGRGPVANYFKYAGTDILEALADLRTRYPTDPTYTAITGVSGGGYATNRYAAAYPDLFAAAAPIVGRPSAPVGACYVRDAVERSIAGTSIYPMLPSFRNLPYMNWSSVPDELNTYPCNREIINDLDALGYRYEFYSMAADHIVPGFNAFQLIADWMGDVRAEINPARVNYTLSTLLMHDPALGLNADGAYWISDLRLRQEAPTQLGTVDVRSRAFGVGERVQTPKGTTTGVADGIPPLAYVREARGWEPPFAEPTSDRLDIVARNIGALTVDVARAGVSCDPVMNVDSDGPVVITLAGCERQGGSQPSGAPARPRTMPTTADLPVTGNDPRMAGVATLALLAGLMVYRRRAQVQRSQS